MRTSRLLRSALVFASVGLAACQADTAVAPGGAVPSRVSVSLASTSPLASFGDTAVVRARVLDAAGNEIPGVPVIYSVASNTVLESVGTGLFRSRGNGTAVIRVQVDPAATGARPKGYYADRLVDSVAVIVQQQPARIVAAADTVFPLINLLRTFGLTATDARGNAITTPLNPQWQSGNPTIATVDATGRVRSVANGSTPVSVRLGAFTWQTTVVVNANRTHVSCMRYIRRKQQQQQCVTNTVTLRAP
jgi:hypothetical protein